jgi:tetratricopeptide (TPR) repeat protein
MTSSTSKWWLDDLTDVCVQFQLDLSCLVDGELDEVAAGRAIAHLEECSICTEFFEDTRNQVRAHRELADPDSLVEHYSALLGASVDAEVETIELVHKLSTIFYQLGKAYVLNASDPGFRLRVFERAVQVGGYQAQGRGFVDGVLESGRGATGGLDWVEARHVLNGKLERIESPLDKGVRLLKEAVAADPTHEEARFYLALADRHAGKTLRAANGFRQLFRTAIEPTNRAHAAVQLGILHADQEDRRRAIACWRWVTMSGQADSDPRFYVVRFNIGINYAHLGDQGRALATFRQLIDRHSDRLSEIVELFANSDTTRAVISQQPGFAEALYETCPELFHQPSLSGDDAGEEPR